MINKLHFGKRISAHRRRAGLSQAELAEKLGVTPQAVSKWECGNAMPDLDLLLELSHLYNVSINELLEGTNLIFRLTGQSEEPSGIALFVPEGEKASNLKWAENMCREKWVKRNWEYAQSHCNERDEVGKYIAGRGGVILELGAGPGGGFMPYILKTDPDATVIISDLSPTVVREWKKHLDKVLDSPNLYYAAFNFCRMP